MKLEKVIEMILEKSSTQEQIVENILTLIELEKYKQMRDLYKNLPSSSFSEYFLNEDREWEFVGMDCCEKEEVDDYIDDLEKLFLSSGYDSLISSYELLLETI